MEKRRTYSERCCHLVGEYEEFLAKANTEIIK
jgi:hypothetical protein